MPNIPHQTPEKIEHFLPEGASPDLVELSLVVPAMNEKITVGEFVDWCHEGLRKAGVTGQILIVDSSSDDTPNIVLAHGGEVLRAPKRGLGRAYIDAIPYIRGKWIIMGDADLTYDFRELIPFVEEFKKGSEFVMGSRFRGSIEDGAMPPLHRYFGTPLTTWILNVIYGSHYSDIHCGMRGLTREAFLKIDLNSQSWEYASEMVLKASRLKMKIAEVPVQFYKDRAGRFSHHKRMGWFSPWIAGWINLKVMLVYSPDSFLLKPGLFLFVLGILLSVILGCGPIKIGSLNFNLHWMFLGMACATLGYSFIQIGIIACFIHKMRPKLTHTIIKYVTYNYGMYLSAMFFLTGLSLLLLFLFSYAKSDMILFEISRPAIIGLLLVILGFQTFCFTIIIETIKSFLLRK